jgi:hypothetical protein
VAEALAVCPRPSESLALQWLALALTPRLGPTRARRLVEHFGGVQNIFKASLTELEATGIQTVSAQSLGTGQSMDLAQDEMGRVAAAGVTIVCLDDSTYPSQLRQIYDPPLILICTRERRGDCPAGNRGRGHAPSHTLRAGDGRAVGLRSRGPRPGDFQRSGPRRGRCCASGRHPRQGEDGGSFRHRRGHYLSQGKQPDHGADAVSGRRPDLIIVL